MGRPGEQEAFARDVAARTGDGAGVRPDAGIAAGVKIVAGVNVVDGTADGACSPTAPPSARGCCIISTRWRAGSGGPE